MGKKLKIQNPKKFIKALENNPKEVMEFIKQTLKML